MKSARSIKLFFIFCSVLFALFLSCKQRKEKLPEDYELATSWADMTNYITKNTPANSPTFASRWPRFGRFYFYHFKA